MEPVEFAAILSGAVMLARMVGQARNSVALIELGFGVVLGILFSLDPNASWWAFIASFASMGLTFLAWRGGRGLTVRLRDPGRCRGRVSGARLRAGSREVSVADGG